MSSNSDDFWTSGSLLVFNFDDDDDDEELHESVDDFIFKTSEDSCVLPIHSLISKTCLDLVLADSKPSKNDIPPIEITVQRFLNGQNSSLFAYRNLKDKISLLEVALDSKDGNLILMSGSDFESTMINCFEYSCGLQARSIYVILFLKQTLKQNIFFLQLSKWKVAVKHYAYHLIVNNRFQELADLYMATGATSNMKQLFYLIGKDVTAKDVLYKRLEHVFIEHLQNFAKNEEKVELCDSMHFLKWQIEQKESATSVVEQLALFCRKELEKKNETFTTIGEFKKQFKIDDYFFEWTVMNVLASLQMWPSISKFFIKNNWLTKKQIFKTAIPADMFVYGLSKHCPPKEVLEEYLLYTTSTERTLQLAQKLGCHKFIIQYYANQKDRSALIAYKEKIRPRSEEYFFIENALQSLDKKWKS